MKPTFTNIVALGTISLSFVLLAPKAHAETYSMNFSVWNNATSYTGQTSPNPNGGVHRVDKNGLSFPTLYTQGYDASGNPAYLTGTPDITGTISSSSSSLINFYSGDDANLETFLTQGFSVGSSGKVTTSPNGDTVDITSGDPNEQIDNAVIEFTGSTYLVNGQTIDFYKDDGFVLYLDGSYIPVDANDPYVESHPTSGDEVAFTFTGATGMYNFELFYDEVNGAPADLGSNLMATPEPSSLLLLGTGFIGLAMFVFARKSSKPASPAGMAV